MKKFRVSVFFQLIFLVPLSAGLQFLWIPTAIAFGGGGGGEEESEEEDPCEEAKEERKKACEGGDKAECEAKKEAKKKACGEETEEAQEEAEEEKEEDHSAQDVAGLGLIDAQISKLVLLRDQANSMKTQFAALLQQLQADAKNACLTSSDFDGHKNSAKAQILQIRNEANEKLHPSKVDEASVDALLAKVNEQIPAITEKYRSAAENKKTVAQGYANEAKRAITDFQSSENQLNALQRAPEGTCGTSVPTGNTSGTSNNVF